MSKDSHSVNKSYVGLVQGCRCDGDVKRVSRSVGIPPGGLKAGAQPTTAQQACNLITMHVADQPEMRLFSIYCSCMHLSFARVRCVASLWLYVRQA